MSETKQVVLVSGGSRGLGRGIVEDLLARGHRVASFSRTPTPFVSECQSRYPEAFLWQTLDGSNFSEVTAYVRQVAKHFGRMDTLINNAAIAVSEVLPLLRGEDIHRMLTVNLESSIHLAQAAARLMLRQRQGVILNISSIIGSRGYSGLSVYSATKGGMDALTRSLARELGPRGVRVNSIAPGYLETEMSETLSSDQRGQIVRRTPLGRLGTVSDVVGAVRFLMSADAAFITGQVLVIDGGITC